MHGNTQLTNKTTYVTDLLDFDKDIAPYPVTLLIGGCGSRKTTAVFNSFKGRTLLVTSRSSKRRETLSDDGNTFIGWFGLDGNIFLKYDDYYEYMLSGKPPQEYEQYLTDCGTLTGSTCVIPVQMDDVLFDAYLSDPDGLFEVIDRIWEQFDVIVIDEVQSIILDSNFMVSQTRIWELIKAFAANKNKSNKRMVLMTATPDIITPTLKQYIPDINILDYIEVTHNTMPTTVRFASITEVRREMELLYQNNIKFFYFTNEAQYLSEFCDDTLLNEADGISLFSSIGMRESLRRACVSEYNRMVDVERYLAENQRLPDDIKFCISTSRNREGLSICNDDIEYVYVDSHIPAEVIQYCGRFRNANFTLTLVDGSDQFEKDLYESKGYRDRDLKALTKINERFAACKTDNDRRRFIKDIETKYFFIDGHKVTNSRYHPYVFFNPFSGKFEFNELRVICEDYRSEYIDSWDNLDRCKKTSFSSHVRPWFSKGVKINGYETNEWQSHNILWTNRFKVNDGVGKPRYYTDKRINTLIQKLTPIWGKLSGINIYLRRFAPDLVFVRVRSGANKGKWELIRKPS